MPNKTLWTALLGWCIATFGGAVMTFGFQSVVEGSASSFAIHLKHWFTISSGLLILIAGAVTVAAALDD